MLRRQQDQVGRAQDRQDQDLSPSSAACSSSVTVKVISLKGLQEVSRMLSAKCAECSLQNTLWLSFTAFWCGPQEVRQTNSWKENSELRKSPKDASRPRRHPKELGDVPCSYHPTLKGKGPLAAAEADTVSQMRTLRENQLWGQEIRARLGHPVWDQEDHVWYRIFPVLPLVWHFQSPDPYLLVC